MDNHSASRSGPRILGESPEALAALGRVEVLYTDLDGTLLGRNSSVLADDTGEPTLETAEAIVAVNRAHLSVVMVSGRNALQLAEATRLLGWTDFIGEVGCVRSVGRDRVLSYSTGDWAPELLPDNTSPYEAIEQAGALDVLQTTFPGRIERHMPWDRDRLATHMLRGDIEVTLAQEVLDALPLPVDIVDNGIIRPPRHGLVGVTQIHAYHLVPRGSSKSRAIVEDLAARGLTSDQAAAIGDSATDLAMADVVGLFALVANGLDYLDMAERVALTPNAYVTRARQGHGWAEFARAWVDARRG